MGLKENTPELFSFAQKEKFFLKRFLQKLRFFEWPENGQKTLKKKNSSMELRNTILCSYDEQFCVNNKKKRP